MILNFMEDSRTSSGGLHRRDLINCVVAASLGLAAAGCGPSNAGAQEGIQHELPIVTHWSNEAKAFEYMASDQPDYRVPPAKEKYRPGDSYYYYREGDRNFLPDLNEYVGMNFSLRAVGKKQVSALAGRVSIATGVDHERLTSYHDGIQRRLTNVHGHVIQEILT